MSLQIFFTPAPYYIETQPASEIWLMQELD